MHTHATMKALTSGAVRMRELRIRRRAAGLCPECGDSPEPGKKHCRVHLYLARRRMREAARQQVAESN